MIDVTCCLVLDKSDLIGSKENKESNFEASDFRDTVFHLFLRANVVLYIDKYGKTLILKNRYGRV